MFVCSVKPDKFALAILRPESTRKQKDQQSTSRGRKGPSAWKEGGPVGGVGEKLEERRSGPDRCGGMNEKVI
tara:strand:+ start:1001 stop:1216 length:216 start_codon:yes stop_codon:yes gene_type:complete